MNLLTNQMIREKEPITIKINRTWKKDKLETKVNLIYYDKKRIALEEKSFGVKLSGMFVAYNDFDFCNIYPIEVVEEIIKK